MRLLFAFLVLTSTVFAEENPVRYGAMPTFNYTSDAGLTWGGYVQRFDYGQPQRAPFENLWTIYASSATRGATHVGAEYEWLQSSDENYLGWRASLESGYVFNPYENYYGLGADTPRIAIRESLGQYEYTRRLAFLQSTLRKPFAREIFGDQFQWRAILSPIWENLREKTAGSQYSQDFGGSNLTQSWRVRHGLGLVWDSRNSEFSPDNGFLIQPTWTSSFFQWHRFDLDFRAHSLLIADRWLSFAAQLRLSEVADSTDLPLNERPRLGGWNSIRGLPSSRYIVHSLAVLRAEVRSVFLRARLFGFPLKIGAAPFVDLGRGANRFGALGAAQTRVGYGISWIGSYFTDDFLGTLDLAWSDGSSAYYLTLGHAF